MMRTPAWWQSRGLVSTLLLPASWLYALVAWADRRFTKPQRAPLPVIAIGNATAGGAGKTPTAIALAQLLQAMGETPHIISRGYGGKPRIAHAVNTEHDSATDVGDEALLLARIVPTWVGANRLASAIAAEAAGASVVIADDAMQHHALQKDITLLVVDAAYGFGNERLIPAGPLREPLAAALGRSDRSIVIGTHATDARLPLPTRATLQPSIDTVFLGAQRWLAFAGIAHPDKFFATLRQHGAVVEATESFADHAPYSAESIARLHALAAAKGLALITTEKDFARLPVALRDGIHTLPVQLQFDDAPALKQWLQQRLAQLRA